MSAAEREAERRWPEGLGRWTDPVRGLLLAAFVAGAEWQADHDPRIAALEAEVEQWRRVAVEQTRLERDRAEAAEAKLDAVRAVCVARTDEYPNDPYDFVREFALVMLAVLDGKEQGDDE